MKGKILKKEKVSQKFHNVFQFTRREAEVTLNGNSSFKFVRHVFETGPAVSVLPYFFDKLKKEWCVILVRQYRPAVDALCLEAPGGLTHDGADLKKEMARELYEEAGIKVKPSKIKVVGSQYLAPSFCDQNVHLGIVELEEKELPSLQKNHGLVSEREFTEVVVIPLSRVIKNKNLVTYTLAKFQIEDLVNRLDSIKTKVGPRRKNAKALHRVEL